MSQLRDLFKRKYQRIKPPTTFLFFGVSCLVGLGYWVKTKNDYPAFWYRFTNRNNTITPVEKPPKLTYSVCSIQGKRDHMEDRFIITPTLSTELSLPLSVFGVFDGHGGYITSTFAKEKFNEVFEKNLTDLSINEIKDNMGNKLSESLTQLHDHLLESITNKSQRDGSTAIICVIGDNKLWTANIGDSRAVLSQSRCAIDLSKDHKPDDPEEQQRIEDAGGEVKVKGCPRVYYKGGNGGLAMSRALGDEFYKTSDNPLVPCNADINEHTLCKEDEFIIIASDGLWDVMSSTEATDYIHLLKYINPHVVPTFLAQALVYEASNRNSTDNITAMIIVFDHEEKEQEKE